MKSIIKAISIALGVAIILAILAAYCLYHLMFPSSRFVVQVVDEEGNPMKGVPVELEFEHSVGTGNPITYKPFSTKTNSSGMVSGKAWADEAGYVINLNGYYKSIGDRSLVNRYEATCKTMLKKIGSPKPMYAKNVVATIPADGKTYSYDLVLGDWLPPLGHGVTPDLVFVATSDWKSMTDYDQELKLSFSNPEDGIQSVLIPTPVSGSALRLPKEAPTSGYLSQWVWKDYSNQNLNSTDRTMMNRAF